MTGLIAWLLTDAGSLPILALEGILVFAVGAALFAKAAFGEWSQAARARAISNLETTQPLAVPFFCHVRNIRSRDHIVDTCQSRADKLAVLQWTCGDQAAQATRAGRVEDAAEWVELRARVGGLK